MGVTPVILLVLFMVYAVWWYNKYLRHYFILKKYSGPKVTPLIGTLPEFTCSTDSLPAILRDQEKYGGVYKIYIGLKSKLVISDAHYLEFILGSNTILNKSFEYCFLHPWLGTGLLTSTGAKWKSHRKVLTPAFHFQILEQFIDVFNVNSNILIDLLSKEVGKKSFDIAPYVHLYALDVICESAMGISVNAQQNSESKYVHEVREMSRITIERTFVLRKLVDFTFQFTEDYRKQINAIKVLHGHTLSVIKGRKEELANTKNHMDVCDQDSGSKKRLAFLDLLLLSTIDDQPIPDEDIREEVDTFMFEGHDTTASAISFSVYCLAKYRDIQDKVVDELRHIFSTDMHRNVTYRDLQEMKYLEMVIKETLRLYPPVPMIGRQLSEDTEIDGVMLPKGLEFNIFIYGLHRKPEFFPEPEKFDPERFSLENQTGRHPYSYVPFSAGARNCIGQRFAMLEIKATLANILRKYELSLSLPRVEPLLAAELVLKSANGVQVRLSERHFST